MSPTSKSLVAFEASPSAPSASSIPELACETSTVAAGVAAAATVAAAGVALLW